MNRKNSDRLKIESLEPMILMSASLEGTDAADWIAGTDAHDVIETHGGDDTVNAQIGNNVIDGGDGTDTLVVYGGVKSQFDLVRYEDGSVIVKGPGLNGGTNENRLLNMEHVLFDDGVVDLHKLPVKPGDAPGQPEPPQPEPPVYEPPVYEPPAPEPQPESMTFRLNNHPDADKAQPGYGLRLDNLLGNGIYTFDFEADGSDVYATMDGPTLHIHGVALGGRDTGSSHHDPGFFAIDFKYDLTEASGDDDLIAAASAEGTNTGTITQLDDHGNAVQTFQIADKAGDNPFTFRLGDEADDHGHRGFEGASGWGWLTVDGKDIDGTQDWIFTVGEKISVPKPPVPEPPHPEPPTPEPPRPEPPVYEPPSPEPPTHGDGDPVAVDDKIYGNANEPVWGNVNVNDYDPNGYHYDLRYTLASEPAVGHVNLYEDGSFDYHPPYGFTGEVRFEYQVKDLDGGVSTAEVCIVIDGQSQPEPPSPEPPVYEPPVYEPPAPEPQPESMTFRLNNHPDADKAQPGYGLRLDNLHGNGIYTFDFEADGSEVYATMDGPTLHIHGVALGGRDTGSSHHDPGFFAIDFKYDLTEASGDDDLIAAASAEGTNTGTITQLDDYGNPIKSFHLSDKAGDNPFTFRAGDEDNDQGHRGFDGSSGWGWLKVDGKDLSGTQDWIFTFGEKVDAPDSPAPIDPHPGGATIVVEAEDLHRSNYDVRSSDSASNGKIARLWSNGERGELTYKDFEGHDGTYNLKMFIQDESDGKSKVQVRVNGHTQGEIKLDRNSDGSGSDDGHFSEFNLHALSLQKHDEVTFWVDGDGGEYVRFDKVVFTPSY